MTAEDRETLLAMITYGGGFVVLLAEAAYRADDDNLRRMKEAWPEYWEQYSKIAKASKST